MSNPVKTSRLGPSALPDSRAFAAALGRRLVAEGKIDELGLARAERARQQSGERLEVVLARLGLVSEDALFAGMAAELGMQFVRSGDLPDTAVAAGLVDAGFLRSHRILPLEETPDRLVVAVCDPLDHAAASALAYHADREIEIRLVTAGDLELAIERLYGRRRETISVGDPAAPPPVTQEDAQRLADLASDAPIIRLVQELVARAADARASDIHVEPGPDALRVRFRIDGVLHTIEKLPLDLAPGIVSRIKVLSRLDIAERRMPQDGRTKSVVRGRELDLRVSTVPTINGESCVLRILDRESVRLEFATLGFDARLIEGLRSMLRQPHGILLVSGPTGSGKTSTLYTSLASLDAEASKIMTVEDPIEYRLPDVNQLQVQPRIGLTFASALRSILRQDPDVIMIGEIRDLETAQIAIQASLTGHLVLSTVHTNSAPATVTRLIDMGLESYLLASSVTGVLAQRLVRRLCTECAAPQRATDALVSRLVGEAGPMLAAAETGPTLRERTGCPSCRGTGYRGRLAIGELLTFDRDIRAIVHEKGSERRIRDSAEASGMASLYQAGLAKALTGETTLEEVLRVTQLD